MIVGLSLTPFGHGSEAWRQAPQSAQLGFHAFLTQAQEAETAGVDFLLLADEFAAPPRDHLSPTATPFDPTLLISALATKVRRIGFLAAQATAQHAPYHLARRFASLDLISAGRSGWLAITAPDTLERDAEYLEVVNGLWDSFEDETFVYDKAAGRFFGPEKMHVLNHRGRNFSVRGPLNVNRSPQGQPVVALLASKTLSPSLAQRADVILIAGRSIDGVTATSEAVRAAVAANGRSPKGVRLLALVAPFAEEASASVAALPVGGAADQVAAALIGLVASANLDGIVALPPTVLAADRFLAEILPALGERDNRDGQTLRERLGLPRPVHPATAGEVKP
ncbi:LLM class flavin-dependent oxidoreductase [Rhizobium sp. CG5]|uniref:LLM class flavin-dependent oxidoreductase n=1 Tax=Rhizobium sp. CG5 TaxID=2726076 RepID=UPI00203401F4|nr:LLM class flavin-dependent oxidoreductase [Rhizobium sp. CG5]MCM2477681.1 LLM class flavin-dependent oxidoreductase [Rhizobium sp. CG5]